MSIDNAATIALVSTFSAEALNEELAVRGMPAQEDTTIAASLLVAGIRSQGEFATIIINVTKGDISPSALKGHLEVAFPTAKISDRHGSHFLCHARTGSLKNCRFRPATANERKRAARGEVTTKMVAVLTSAELFTAAEAALVREKAQAEALTEAALAAEATPEAIETPKADAEVTPAPETAPEATEETPKAARKARKSTKA